MKGNNVKRILFSIALISCTPALADAQRELDGAFYSINSSYAKIRVASDNCGYPMGEWISFKTRVLDALSLNPRIDVLKLDRDMDRFYEGEKSRMSRQCNEPQREMYQRAIDSMDKDIARLRDLVIKAR